MPEVPKQEDQPIFEYIDPREYLEKKLRDGEHSDGELRESLKRLSVPLKSIDYKEDGEVEVNTNEMSFSFTFSDIEKGDFDDVEDYINKQEKGVINGTDEAEKEKYKRIIKFVFQKDNYKKDIFDSLPTGTKIFFCPTEGIFHGSVMSDEQLSGGKKSRHRIFIIGDMSTPRSIMTLLHEMGHIFDYKNLEKFGIPSQMEKGTHSETAERLRRERVASAFAFKMARPFLTNRQLRRDALAFLKNYALSSYERWAKDQIVVNLAREKYDRALINEWEAEQQEIETMGLFDEFWKWKETGAYKKWKGSEAIKKLELEDYEEFNAWRSWVEENNYDYEKDLEK